MKTSARELTPVSHSSWPFPAADHFRKVSAATPPSSSSDEDDKPDDEVDPVEQELVNEQKERDRKAAHSVDPNRKDRPAP